MAQKKLIVRNQTSTKTPITKKFDVAKVADATDIVSLILDYGIDLIAQENGEYICICPFHGDTDPSMRVYPQTNSFFCFGCQAGATVFEFVMRMENIEFKDALQKLAEKAGYSTEFTLRDIKVARADENFTTVREKVERVSHQHAKKVYKMLRESGIISKQELFYMFEDLWGWYDEQQAVFSRKFLKGADAGELINALYRFYNVFIKKLNALEEPIDVQ